MDSVEEIVANKTRALVGRQELRDLVDLYFLEQAGFRVEDYLEDAATKDAGVSPAVLAWLLASFPIGDDLPGGIAASELKRFAQDLEHRMRNRSWPG